MTDSASDDLEERWHKLLFSVRRSIRYHMRRRRFYERWNTFITASAVIFGSATVVSLMSHSDQRVAVGFAISLTVLQAFDLVIGTGRLAWLHSDLNRRFIELEKRVVSATQDEAALVACTNERLDIEADEPPVLHVLNIICDNELVLAQGHDLKYLHNIPWYSRWLSNYLDVCAESIRRAGP